MGRTSEDDDEAEESANLVVGHASPTVEVSFDFPAVGGKRKAHEITCKEAPDDGDYASVGIPIMYNDKKVSKHTKLVAMYDKELSRLAALEKEKAKASAKKAARTEAIAKKSKKQDGEE